MSKKNQRRRSQARRDIIRAWRAGIRPINGYLSEGPLQKVDHITLPASGPSRTGELVLGVDMASGADLTAVVELEREGETSSYAVRRMTVTVNSHADWNAPSVVAQGFNEHGEHVTVRMVPTFVQTLEEWFWRKGLLSSWFVFPIMRVNRITLPEPA